MRYKHLSLFAVLLITACLGGVAVAEQVERDMFAAVIVNSAFNCYLDNPSLNFGYVEAGKPVELNPNAHYNTVKCNSNKGKTWYLKLSIMEDIVGTKSTVPPESVKCRVLKSTGSGIPVPAEGWLALSKEPQAVYTSGPSDNTGADVILYMQYKLELPQGAVSGYYRTKVLYTMTDMQ